MNATIKPETSLPSEPQVRSSEWLGVGAVGVIHIVNDMKREARQWKDFASANQLQQKQDYYRGKEDALAELLKVLKVLAPTPNDAGQPRLADRDNQMKP